METRAPWGAQRPRINGWPASPPRSPWPSTARDSFCCFHAGRGCADGATPSQGPWAVTGGVSRRGLDFGESIPRSTQPVPVLPNKGIPHQCPVPSSPAPTSSVLCPALSPNPTTEMSGPKFQPGTLSSSPVLCWPRTMVLQHPSLAVGCACQPRSQGPFRKCWKC